MPDALMRDDAGGASLVRASPTFHRDRCVGQVIDSRPVRIAAVHGPMSPSAGRISSVRTVTVQERRARLGRRHLLTSERQAAPDRAAEVVTATRAMVCLHATDPASLYLSAQARVPGLTRADVDRALYEDRTLVKQLCMRRTLFVLSRDLLGPAVAGAGQRVADAERRRLARSIEAGGIAVDGAQWLVDAEAQVVRALGSHPELTPAALRDLVPSLDATVRAGSGKWAADVPLAPRLLTILSAAGAAVRAHNRGGWMVSRPLWTSMHAWLGVPLDIPTPRAGRAALVRAWLYTFGPGTVSDIAWWLGGTRAGVRHALADVGAVEVTMEGSDEVGHLLPDDLDAVAEPDPWVALLPALDPTVMGWTAREWYLGPHRDLLFDTNGNAGPTAWCDGRVVGGWHQDAEGRVVLDHLESLGSARRKALAGSADELTAWLAGDRVRLRFPSPLSKAGEASAGSPLTVTQKPRGSSPGRAP